MVIPLDRTFAREPLADDGRRPGCFPFDGREIKFSDGRSVNVDAELRGIEKSDEIKIGIFRVLAELGQPTRLG